MFAAMLMASLLLSAPTLDRPSASQTVDVQAGLDGAWSHVRGAQLTIDRGHATLLWWNGGGHSGRLVTTPTKLIIISKGETFEYTWHFDGEKLRVAGLLFHRKLPVVGVRP
jgi:hypothetical protein